MTRGQLALSKDKWFVKLYIEADKVWTKFSDDTITSDELNTNLCYFIRVTFVYLPMVVLMHVAAIIGLVAGLTATPIYYFGFSGYSQIVVLVLAFFGVVSGILFWKSKIDADPFYYQKKREKRKRKREEREKNGPGFFATIHLWLMAKKHKICPLIEITTPTPEEEGTDHES